VLWAERVGKGKGRGKLGKTNICFGLCSGTQKRSVKHGADEDPLAYATFWAGLKSKFYHKNCKRGWYQLVKRKSTVTKGEIVLTQSSACCELARKTFLCCFNNAYFENLL